MPIVAIVDGVAIQFFFGDHPPPHFHVRFAEHTALIVIGTLELLEGSLPPAKLQSVKDWARKHETELIECWKRAAARQHPGKIG
jgi:hypothetical protein